MKKLYYAARVFGEDQDLFRLFEDGDCTRVVAYGTMKELTERGDREGFSIYFYGDEVEVLK